MIDAVAPESLAEIEVIEDAGEANVEEYIDSEDSNSETGETIEERISHTYNSPITCSYGNNKFSDSVTNKASQLISYKSTRQG